MTDDRMGGGPGEGRGPTPDENDASGAGSTPAGNAAGDPSGGMMSGAMTMSGINDENIAAEAAALGAVDGALADEEAGEDPHVNRRSGAEGLGGGAGLGEPGSGTPGDKGELGGGGAGATREGSAG